MWKSGDGRVSIAEARLNLSQGLLGEPFVEHVVTIFLHRTLRLGQRTLPFSRFATANCRPISRILSGALFYFCVEVREMTLRPDIFDRRIRISS